MSSHKRKQWPVAVMKLAALPLAIAMAVSVCADSNLSGGGGRVSVHADNMDNFYGDMAADGGSTDWWGEGWNQAANVGTIFTQTAEMPHGMLVVAESNGISQRKGATVIRSLGRHQITNIEHVEGNLWRITVNNGEWHASTVEDGLGMVGFRVSLEANNANSPSYAVVANGINTLTIESDDDLSTVPKTELIGVHVLDAVRLGSEAHLSFGEDRLDILDMENSWLAGTSTLDVGVASQALLAYAQSQGARLQLEYLELPSLDLSGGSQTIRAKQVHVLGDVTLDGFELKLDTGKIVIDGDMQLTNSAVIRLDPDAKNDVIDIKVANQLTVEEGSLIQAAIYDSQQDWLSLRQGCHAGAVNRYSMGWNIEDVFGGDCTYGRYESAMFPSAGENGHAGVVTIEATALALDGIIAVTVPFGWESSAAGGSVNITSDVIAGSGTVLANGVGTAGGGRVSINVGDSHGFNGSIQAYGSQEQVTERDYMAGAGTVFIKHPERQYGELTVENNLTNNPSADSYWYAKTPVRSVGKHTISSITETEPGLWAVDVDNAQWQPSEPEQRWGLDGLQVDLQAADAGTTEELLYTIESNTENRLYIRTDGELTGYQGAQLIGVHTLDKLTVKNGGFVDFGDDRLVVNKIGESNFGALGIVAAGEMSDDLQYKIISNQCGLILHHGTLVLQGLEMQGKTAVYGADNIDIQGNVALAGSTLELAVPGRVSVTGQMSLISGSTITSAAVINPSLHGFNPINLEIGSSVGAEIDATSKIDQSGNGRLFQLPDGEQFNHCHGGCYSPSSVNYDDYSHALLPGSSYNSGGYISLTANNVSVYGQLLADGGSDVGGGIHLSVNNLQGNGKISADGPLAGGRVSQHITGSNSFIGTVTANGDAAGTVYAVKPAESYGVLKVSGNGDGGYGWESPYLWSTKIRSVGRHTISNIYYDDTKNQWAIKVDGAAWRDSATYGDYVADLAGLQVDLDASDNAGTLYTIASNTEDTLYVNNDLSGSDYVGKDVIGVHTLKSIELKQGASLDFGADRLDIIVEPYITGDGTGSIRFGQASANVLNAVMNSDVSFSYGGSVTMDQITFAANKSRFIEAKDLVVDHDVTVDGRLSIGASQNLTIHGSVLINNEGVLSFGSSSPIHIGSDLTVNYGKLSSRSADINTGTIYPLALEVAGTVLIGNGGSVDVAGQGYPRGFAPDPLMTACHGGVSSRFSGDPLSCVYGDYRSDILAGSGNQYGPGGGVVAIEASSITVNGLINAGTYVGGAGGSIYLNASAVAGTGFLGVAGGENQDPICYRAEHDLIGGGGRIAIETGIYTFTNHFGLGLNFSNYSCWNGGLMNVDDAAAGTAFVRLYGHEHGQLTVDNAGGVNGPLRGTPMPVVGQNTITAITPLENNQWLITVVGTPWSWADGAYARSLAGTEVDLNVSAADNAVYEISANTESTLTIQLPDGDDTDLSGFVGSTLIGVHSFESIIVRGGAQVDFGNDRVVVTEDPALSVSVVGSTSHVYYGESNVDINKLRPVGYTPISINFNDGLIPQGWTQPLDANAGWSIASSPVYEGTYSLVSNPISHNQKAAMQWSGYFGAGYITFNYRTSSQLNGDYFKFYMDNSLVCSRAGTSTSWLSCSVSLNTAGNHIFRWEYSKDASVVSGSDTVWIDNIKFTPNAYY